MSAGHGADVTAHLAATPEDPLVPGDYGSSVCLHLWPGDRNVVVVVVVVCISLSALTLTLELQAGYRHCEE